MKANKTYTNVRIPLELHRVLKEHAKLVEGKLDKVIKDCLETGMRVRRLIAADES
jgi:hypothetical protein